MPSGDVQDRPRTDAPRAVRHHLGILVHRLLHGHHHHVRNPAVGGFFFMTVFMLGLAIPYHAGEPRYLNRQLAVGKAGAIVGSFGFLYAVCVTVEGQVASWRRPRQAAGSVYFPRAAVEERLA
jgi:hypothetical protein